MGPGSGIEEGRPNCVIGGVTRGRKRERGKVHRSGIVGPARTMLVSVAYSKEIESWRGMEG